MASQRHRLESSARALLRDRASWDTLPLVGVGQTATVLRHGSLVVKVAHSTPDARARLKEEVALSDRLRALGVRTPRIVAASPSGRALVRPFVEGRLLSSRPRLSPVVRDRLRRLLETVEPLEVALDLRFDVSPSNLLERNGALWLLDAGRRVAPSVLRADDSLDAAWSRWFSNRRRRPRLEPFTFPPSGRFHVEVPVGVDRGAKLAWSNQALARRLGLDWTPSQLGQLGALSTKAKATTTAIATRYVDMIALDRRSGPKGDGRSVLLGRLPSGKELSLKGCGPTPLTWRGRAFHEDGFVSFPRALWEVTAADELARLGFDVPEYLALFTTSHTTLDNTGNRWPAAAGIRVASTHLRLGHLRAVSHRPERLRAMLTFAGRAVVRTDFDAARPSHLSAFVKQFAANLGHDIGRTDALQVHGFNPTPGNVRLDGHLIDFSTVRFHRHYLPDWRFLENAFAVRMHRLVWRRLVSMLVRVLREGGLEFDERLALRWYDRAYVEGFDRGLGSFFQLRECSWAERRRLVELTQRLRALRSNTVLEFRYWKQRVPAPKFDLLGRARLLMGAIDRGHRAPHRVSMATDEDLPAREERLACAWVDALKKRLPRRGAWAKSWEQVVRPELEPERLASLLYERSAPGRFEEWKRFIATSRHLPEGRHSHARAKAFAEQLGHVVLPGPDGTHEERIVGLTPELLAGVRRSLRRILGGSLVGCVAHGSRVLDRSALRRLAPAQLRGNDLRVRGSEGVREFGPVPGRTSDLDLKVFIRGRFEPAELTRLEVKVGEALAGLGAWFPFSGHVPPRQRLIVTTQRDLGAAFRSWNGEPRREALGKGPIPERQVVVVLDPSRRD